MDKETKKSLADQVEMDGYTAVDGPAIAAKILRKMPTATRLTVVHRMYDTNPALAVKVQDSMYNFNEIRELNAQSAQMLVREVQPRDLALSLAAATPEVKQVLLSNMSERKREIVLEETESINPAVSPVTFKEAQWRILEKLDQLREAGAVRSQIRNGILA